MTNLIIYVGVALLGGAGAGYVARIYIAKNQRDQFEQKQKELLLEAKSEALKIKEDAKKEEEKQKKDLQELEKSLRRREEMIDRRLESVEDEKKKIVDKNEKSGISKARLLISAAASKTIWKKLPN